MSIFSSAPRPQYKGPTTSAAQSAELAPSRGSVETFTVANGCFWGTEHMYTRTFKDKFKSISVGYIGGAEDNPHYRLVCSGTTGHAESCQITFDPSEITFAELCEFNYRMHDPTTKDRQDYRSIQFYHSPEQKQMAERIQAELQENRFSPIGKTIVTEIVDAAPLKWWDAEAYHQHYSENNPGGYECPTRMSFARQVSELPALMKVI